MAWEALFSFDLMIFILTLRRTYQQRQSIEYPFQERINLVTLIFRDGKSVSPLKTFASHLTVIINYRRKLLRVSVQTAADRPGHL